MPKIGLKQVKGTSFLTDGFLSIGVYFSGKEALLIDSGGDDSCAKDVSAALDSGGYTATTIINTHCHPDHCGGNSFFQKKDPNIAILAAYNEKFFIEDPIQAPRCFCSGAAAFSGLKNKYIAPQKASKITQVIAPYEDQEMIINRDVIRIITLPGHTQGMVGVITPDNVLYSGDALFGRDTLKKHPILFYTDIAQALASFDTLEKLSVDACVLYHGGVIHDLPVLVAEHRNNLMYVKHVVAEIIREQPCSIDLLTQRIMQHYALPNSMVTFTLTQTAMKAYLTLLEAEGTIQLVINDGLLQAVHYA